MISYDEHCHLNHMNGLNGYNVKLEIGAGCCYLKYAMLNDKIYWLDVVLSSTGDQDSIETTDTVAIATSKLDNNRSLIEIACREATVLLQCGQWNIGDLCRAWRGTQFDPAGLCVQVKAIVKSPFDAVAQYFFFSKQRND